jgi:hypothetical protein
LGEDCDLTIAWMAGAAEARDRAKARIEALEAKLAKAVEGLREIADAFGCECGDAARATLAEIEGEKG